MILSALQGRPLPVYGKGENVRDWLHVEDHARALATVLAKGRPGETYNIGGDSEQRNIAVVGMICDLVDELRPGAGGESCRRLITFVDDRHGHDLRHAIDASKAARQRDRPPPESFESGHSTTRDGTVDPTQDGGGAVRGEI